MNNIAILGPGGGVLNKSMKKTSRKLVKSTVSKNYFKHIWNHRSKNYNYSVLNEKGNMVGFALLKNKNKNLEISLIGTTPGKGIGKLLIEQIKENTMNKNKHNRITLNSVPTAKAFYEKLNFKTNKQNDEHILMHFNLNPQSPPKKKVKVSRLNTN
jgi:hypothetical protein